MKPIQRYYAHEAAMATTTRRLATEEDLRNTPDDGIYELVDGEIRRMSLAGGTHGKTSMALVVRLGSHVEQQRLGHVFGPDTGHRLPSGNVRCPDVSFVRAGRFPDEVVPTDWVNLPPDLAVEVVSPNDRLRWILDKVGEYLEAGVRLVWVIDPQKRRATAYRSLLEVRELGSEDHLDGEDVVPGFRCRLGELFES
jgi:Uma2 family endonuclease